MKTYSPLLFSVLVAAAVMPACAADVSGFYIGLEGRADQPSWNEGSFTATYRKETRGTISSSTGTAYATSFPQDMLGLGLVLGYRFSPYLALEVGYSITTDEARELDNNSDRFRYRMTVRDASLDALGYWPIGETGRFRPFVSVGLAYATSNARLRADIDGSDTDYDQVITATYTPYFQKKEINWRLGGGIEVRLSDSIYGRIFARYTPYSFGKKLDSNTTLGFSINTKIF